MPPQYFRDMGDLLAEQDAAQQQVFGDQFTGRSGKAYGAQTRFGYLTGPAVGREKGIAPLEFMPYAFFDEGLFFLDFRGSSPAAPALLNCATSGLIGGVLLAISGAATPAQLNGSPIGLLGLVGFLVWVVFAVHASVNLLRRSS